MAKNMPYIDVIVIGAGAAGMMCALEAGRRGRSTLILEHNSKVGKKIRISGGGRCNFTNIHTTPQNFLSNNPHFAKSALSRYTPEDFRKWIEDSQIPYHEKKLGQLFCDHSAQDVIDLLVKNCQAQNITIQLDTQITNVTKDQRFRIETNHEPYECDRLVIATGGLSIPPLGATDFGYKLAKKFDIEVTPRKPGLVPFTLCKDDLQKLKPLAGISVDSIVTLNNISFRENILFTHKGLSGPAILQISSYWQDNKKISINLIPDQEMIAILNEHTRSRITLKNFLKDFLPTRLTETLCTYYLPNKPLNQYNSKEIEQIGTFLNNWIISPKGTEGYAKAEVTVGGVNVNELSSKTMESRKVPGLFFIGEVVDVTGHLGGFNFQWAWASGHAAGQYV